MNRYDLVLVGGGMAGLTLLAAITPAIEQGLTVALIDPAPMPTPEQTLSPSFDDRATALSAHALSTFKDLKLVGLEEVVSKITRIEVSDQGHLGYHNMDANQLDFAAFGGVVSNRALGGLLWNRTKDLGVNWHFKTEVCKIRPVAAGHLLTLSSEQTLQASMVLLCDGGRSGLTEQLGIKTNEYPFHACARVAVVKTSQPHQGAAFERFTATGPVALLPFGDYSALVWTIPQGQRHLLPKTPTEAIPWLNQHVGQRLGRITEVSNWVEYPLIEKTVSTLALHNLLLLGNSAATLHPVAGQGFNLAIRGITRSAEKINKLWQSQQRLPNFAELSLLASDILKDQNQTVLLSRELIRTFASKNPLIQFGRGLGLGSLDRHPSFSKAFALTSMGLLSNTPTLS